MNLGMCVILCFSMSMDLLLCVCIQHHHVEGSICVSVGVCACIWGGGRFVCVGLCCVREPVLVCVSLCLHFCLCECKSVFI